MGATTSPRPSPWANPSHHTSVTYAPTPACPSSPPPTRTVGIILQVTPFIFANGLVEMIVAPQISLSQARPFAIAPGFNAPAIDIRFRQHGCHHADGETVVIGGLMEMTKITVTTKIPILGDIPLIAPSSSAIKGHTEEGTPIFLTPHVVLQPSELASATRRRRQDGNSRRAFTETRNSTRVFQIALKSGHSAKHNWRMRRLTTPRPCENQESNPNVTPPQLFVYGALLAIW